MARYDSRLVIRKAGPTAPPRFVMKEAPTYPCAASCFDDNGSRLSSLSQSSSSSLPKPSSSLPKAPLSSSSS